MVIHVAFQLGFCTFVLSNYMKTLPKELNEAAVVDGASVWRTYWTVIMPLTRPALAALATLQVTWIYNDFFWALILMFTGEKRPITSALNQLKGQFFTDNNLIAAGAILVAIPTLIVFFALQKQIHQRARPGLHEGVTAVRDGPPPWETPELTGVGRLPMHSVPHPDRLAARRSMALPAAAERRTRSPPPRGARRTCPAAGRCRAGATCPTTRTSQMPFPGLPPASRPANPTGVYERDVRAARAWAGRRVVLHVGAAESVLLVTLNGRRGRRQQGLPPGRRVRRHATSSGRGRTRSALTVVKWSDATYVEDQDQWWHGGITRSVFLYATDPVHLADVRADAGLADDLATGTLELTVEVAFAGGAPEPGWTVEAAVPRADRPPGRGRCPITGRHEGPRPRRHRRELAVRAHRRACR